MTQPSAFLTHGLAEAQSALAGIADRIQAHLNPVTLARTLAQRAVAELARLEVIVRRLLTLMALVIELSPVRPRAAAPLLARLAALQQVLAAPDTHARRLVRSLEYQRRAGEAWPLALPMPRTHRLPPAA